MTSQRKPADDDDDRFWASVDVARGVDVARIGRNVKAAREQAGMSQTAFAQAMVAAGCKGWRQTTVSRTERGERALKVSEAEAMGRVLPGATVLQGTRLGKSMKRMAHTAMPHAIAAQLDVVNREVEQLNRMWKTYSEQLKREDDDG